MNIKKINEKKELRIKHVYGHAFDEESTTRRVDNIKNNIGDRRACFKGLAANAKAKAIYYWFGENNFNLFRQWFYISAKLLQQTYLIETESTPPRILMLELMSSLLSNNKSMIDWFANFDEAFHEKRREDFCEPEFHGYSALLAIRGDWPRLSERCEKILSGELRSAKEKKFLIDHQFFYGLAQGDVSKMEAALQEILSDKEICYRKSAESGLTEDLVSTFGMLYCKIAASHGYELNIESLYIPKEWLNNEPLENYDKYYAFLPD